MNPNTSSFSISADFFEGGLATFADQLRRHIAACTLRLDGLEIDHVAVRPTSVEAFVAAREALSIRSTHVSSREINGREILAFRLAKPIEVLGREVLTVELPFPSSPTNVSAAPWDHVEFLTSEICGNEAELRTWMNQQFGAWESTVPDTVEYSFRLPTPDNPTIMFKDRSSGIMFGLHPIAMDRLREGSWKDLR